MTALPARLNLDGGNTVGKPSGTAMASHDLPDRGRYIRGEYVDDVLYGMLRNEYFEPYGESQAPRSASLLISSIILRLITNVIASMGKRPNASRLFQSGL